MKNQKNERGITLVALVVTIVVLLILAGITIMYVMSDNGVFGKAQEAGTKSDAAAVQEAVSTALTSIYPEIYVPSTGGVTSGVVDLTKAFRKNLSSSMVTTFDAETGTGIVTAPVGNASELAVTAFDVTYKGKKYNITYSKTDETHLKDGTGGILATPQK